MVGEIQYGQESRERILTGIEQISNAVKVTLGPKGRNVLIMQDSGIPAIVKNGAMIANAADLKDRCERIGSQIMKETAAALQNQVGDGTTTAMILTESILREEIRNIAAGANAVELRRGIQGIVQLSCAAIKKLSRPVRNPDDIRNIAAVSSGSESVGALISEAFERIGPEGVITVEETPGMETVLEITEGMQYEKGYLNTAMIKDQGTLSEELEHPYILVTDYEITNAQELLPLLEAVHAKGRPLLIIAEKVAMSALSMLIMNKKEGIINAIAVHPPAYGDGRKDQMEDICIFTGGTWISEQTGYALSDITLDMLGTAEKAVISKNRTVILNGGGDPVRIQAHLATLRRMIQTEDYDFKLGRLKERLAKFTGGAAVIKVGAPTDLEMKEMKYQTENAVQAVKAALDEGIVPGGGTIYLDILPAISAYVDSLEGDRRTGAAIVLKALEMPARQIAENAGKDASVVISKVKSTKRGVGYDIQKDAYVDMLEAGIVDSAKTARLALQCAASAASTLMTVEAGITAISKTGEEMSV